MKTAMKKLLSLALVAVLLICAVPFQASAAGSDSLKATVYVNSTTVNGTIKVDFGTPVELSKALAKEAWPNFEGKGKYYDISWNINGSTFAEKSTYTFQGDESVYVTLTHNNHHDFQNPVIKNPTCTATGTETTTCTICGQENVITIPVQDHTLGNWVVTTQPTATTDGVETQICTVCQASLSTRPVPANGVTVTFVVDGNVFDTKKVTPGNTVGNLPTVKKSGYVFDCWRTADGGVVTENTRIDSAVTFYADMYENNKVSNDSYKIYLNIYLAGQLNSVHKRLEITEGIAEDGKVTMGEVEKVVFNYYNAKDAKGIQFDGLYAGEGHWVSNYLKDVKYDQFTDLDKSVNEGNVYMSVVIDNAQLKNTSSSSNADPSNPKTGDMIVGTMTVMALSAAALAAVYYVNRKRQVQ